MLLVHGIYGSGRNWGSVARRLVAERPEWAVVLVDMRCHGRSTGFAPPHTVEACAADLRALEERLGFRADAVLGHSYGGKVALVHARMGRHAVGQTGQIWLIDSSPGAGRPGGAAWRMLDVLRRRAGPFPSRRAAQAAVEAEGFSPAVAAWMATNVIRRGGGCDGSGAAESWHWRLNPGEMEALLRDYFRTDAWDVVEDLSAETEVRVVKATESSVWDPTSMRRLRKAARARRRLRFHEVAGGHWLNADNPRAVQTLLTANLP